MERPTMKRINVAFVDFWEGFNCYENLFVNILRKKYCVNVIEGNIDIENVQYLFYSVFSNNHKKYNCIKIFYTGENISPDMNECDYAIGFDYACFGDRYFRFPLYMLYERSLCSMQRKTEALNETMANRKFCSMVVFNPNADPSRELFFFLLSQYKRVDSGGRYLNNIDCLNGVPSKYEFQKNYKFSIAFENSSHPGYCTEKIVQSFAAKTIPIYWGDPTVAEQFNEKAFVNCHKYKNWDEVVEVVKQIDQNDRQYLDMLQQQATDNSNIYSLREEFERWLLYVFGQEYITAYRRKN